MNTATLIAVCVVMSLGLAVADYGYGDYGYASAGYPAYPAMAMPVGGYGGINNQYLMLIGFLFLFMILFSNNSLFNFTSSG